MNLLVRLFWIFAFSRFKKRGEVFDPYKINMRVWPTDLDVLMHVNNGKYFSMMDLGRMDMMIRSNLFSKIRQQNMYPVVSAEYLKFKKLSLIHI